MKFTVKSIALSGVALGMFVSAASAADMPMAAPADWTGFWVGAGVGYQMGMGDLSTSAYWDQSGFPTEIDQEPFAAGSYNSDSFLGTIGAGFDYQFGSNLVVGLFGDYSFAGDNSSGILGGSDNDLSGGTSGFVSSYIETNVAVGDNWTVGGRIGFLASESTLIYGLVGYTQAKAEWDWESGAFEDVFISGFGSAAASGSEWLDGVTFGGGVETMLTENLSAKVEYRYTDLGDLSDIDNVDIDSNFYDLDDASASGDVALHSVRATVSWRF